MNVQPGATAQGQDQSPGSRPGSTADSTPGSTPGLKTARVPTALTVIACLLVMAALHYGRDVFVPIALAALLAFLLDPLVTRLRRFGLPRAV